jgi:small subunit ribosomal protein S1
MKDTDDFEALLAELERGQQGTPGRTGAAVGDKVRGTVVAVGEEQVFIDLGGKSEGIMDPAALRGQDGVLTVAVGDTVEAVVTGIDEESGALFLGDQKGRHLHGTEELEQAYRERLPVQGRVTGAIKGGLEVQIAGHRAFCPASQIDIRFVEDLSEFVGQHLDFRITKLEGGRKLNLVVSRRTILEEQQRTEAEALRARLVEGAVLTGTVRSIKDYGVFVDLGGIEGMIHISELAFHRVQHPSELLGEGQQVEVAVLRIEQTGDPKRPEKIALSMRALARDPWTDVPNRYPVGTRVQGKVTRLQGFGAFVELAPGVEGLVHISELGTGRRVNHPNEVLTSGQQVEAVVLDLDLEKKRIGLSLDEAKTAEAGVDLGAYAAPAKTEEGNVGSFGALLKESMKKKR